MKQLVITPCLVHFGDDAGAEHRDIGAIIDVPKDVAEKLARADRTLYVSRKDDPTKTGQYTATEAMLKAAEDMVKVKAKEPAKD